MKEYYFIRRGGELTMLGILCCILVSCTGIARGITEGLVGTGSGESNTPSCRIQGPSFQGIDSFIQAQNREVKASTETNFQKTTKLLMVHGIGSHLPGYSQRFAENLTRAMGLTVRDQKVKEIVLRSQEFPDEDVGLLNVQRFFNQQDTKELLFYELTWSPIIKVEKEELAGDNLDNQSVRGANLNNAMKDFLNDKVSDPLIYLGNHRAKILESLIKAGCWMTFGDWDDLEPTSHRICQAEKSAEFARQLAEDDYVFVSHSLGSRIVVDMYQDVILKIHALKKSTDLRGRGQLPDEEWLNLLNFLSEHSNKDIQLFMLANQLPLLELGRDRPPVTGQRDQYCPTAAPKSQERLFKSFSIIAFSDPNDLLSYSLPPNYADTYLDSRLCPRITNVTLNVAPVKNFLGVGQFANPFDAHDGYENDDVVIALIAKGIGRKRVDPLVAERCDWLEIGNEN